MRKIKFRAWDNGKMHYKFKIEFDDTGLIISGINTLGLPELMQYTGLKDKNGKDIYEGDVVRSYNIKNYGNEPIKEHDRIKKVVYKKHSFMFEKHDKDFEGRTLASEDCEVIGNIYEKPELI